MKLTDQQKAIINHQGDLKINAVAGSGKTTTLIHYADARPKSERILYIAFNNSVKQEAIRKFRESGLSNVDVMTAHGLAFRHTVPGSGVEISNGYSIHQLVLLFDLAQRTESYLLANHVREYASYFCNSTADKVTQLNYLDIVSDPQALSFAQNHYKTIEDLTRRFLAKMNSGEIAITHDFYLKKFQLKSPKLSYDTILFDEGQDASPSMLDVFRNQKATGVIVGDTHQQIYGWRHAVNALEQVDYTELNLSTSFRFSPEIAALAGRFLDWKFHLTDYTPLPILGGGRSHDTNNNAVIARTNLALLSRAIQLVFEEKSIQSLYFEGNLNTYTYAADGASLFDVLYLKNGNHEKIRDPMIRSFEDLDQLETYIKQSDDRELGMMLEMVKKYGNDLWEYIDQLKAMHVDDDKRDHADMIFSTVHRCKGMEYDTVRLEDDFITEEKVIEQSENAKLNDLDRRSLIEEINLLYVACTRTRNRITLPESLLPESQIEVISPVSDDDFVSFPEDPFGRSEPSPSPEESFQKSGQTMKTFFKDRSKKWTNELDQNIVDAFHSGHSIKRIAKDFKRSSYEIKKRLHKLGIER